MEKHTDGKTIVPHLGTENIFVTSYFRQYKIPQNIINYLLKESQQSYHNRIVSVRTRFILNLIAFEIKLKQTNVVQ